MADEVKNTLGSDGQVNQAGSPDDLVQSKPDPNTGGVSGESGQEKPQEGAAKSGTDEGAEETVPKKDYEELEKKLGENSNEVGEYRKFIDEITPLLNVLKENPEITQAIIDGKIDGNLAKAALDGKVTIQEAETVSKAHDEVKEELGQKKYDKASPEDIQKLVEEKIAQSIKKASDDIEKKAIKRESDSEAKRNFTKDFEDFTNATPDLKEYMPAIEKWFDKNPDQYDIKVAYAAVKGIALAEAEEKRKETEAAEEAKDVAANAAGGGSQTAAVINDRSIADELVAKKANPNIF